MTVSNCLCIYYSRTGNTRAVMEKIAELLDAELLEITDGKARKLSLIHISLWERYIILFHT